MDQRLVLADYNTVSARHPEGHICIIIIDDHCYSNVINTGQLKYWYEIDIWDTDLALSWSIFFAETANDSHMDSESVSNGT